MAKMLSESNAEVLVYNPCGKFVWQFIFIRFFHDKNKTKIFKWKIFLVRVKIEMSRISLFHI